MAESTPPIGTVIAVYTLLDPNSTERQQWGILLNNGHPTGDSYQAAENYGVGVEQNAIIATIRNYEAHPFQAVGTIAALVASLAIGGPEAGAAGAPADLTAAQELANAARSLPAAERPSAVAAIATRGGRPYGGGAGIGDINSTVQAILDRLASDIPNPYKNGCAELRCASNALNDGADLNGASITTAMVRGSGSTTGRHGLPIDPCPTCNAVLNQLGLHYDG
jgi:hypothetical protein